jgi:general nucleoside transport system ATP-binding protein
MRTIFFEGEPLRLSSTEKAISLGIGMVYQHFKLVEAMTVAENVYLGHIGGFWLDWRTIHNEVRSLASRYGMQIDPEARISSLSMGEKQQVEILKLLHRKSTILIFDEPQRS